MNFYFCFAGLDDDFLLVRIVLRVSDDGNDIDDDGFLLGKEEMFAFSAFVISFAFEV